MSETDLTQTVKMNELFSPAGLASKVLSNPKQTHEHTHSESKGGFPVMAETTRKLAASTH